MTPQIYTLLQYMINLEIHKVRFWWSLEIFVNSCTWILRAYRIILNIRRRECGASLEFLMSRFGCVEDNVNFRVVLL